MQSACELVANLDANLDKQFVTVAIHDGHEAS